MCGISTGTDAKRLAATGLCAAKASRRAILAAGIFLGILSWLLAAGAARAFNLFPYYKLDGFKGKVVDADTGEPIAGAAVLAVYHESRGISVAGSTSVPVDGRETTTDQRGEFEIPELTQWFGEKSGIPRGKLMIFKAGYGVLGHERARAEGVNKSWPPPGRYIVYALPKLRTPEEMDRNPILLPLLPEELWPEYKRQLNRDNQMRGLPPLPPTPDPYYFRRSHR